jgi:nickel-dependent lactate racemase
MVTGIGSVDTVLTEEEIAGIIEEGISGSIVEGKRVLVLTPDRTRTMPLPLMRKVIERTVGGRARRLDFMVALGTHKPLSDREMKELFGLGSDEMPVSSFYNHRWDLPSTFTGIGKIRKREVEKITDGFLSEDIEIVLNRSLFEYDIIVVLGPVFPHVVIGFSGGNKYFFPGVSGGEFLHSFHWLGALVGSMEIIGKKRTTTRALIDRAASFIKKEKICISMVVGPEKDLRGLFVGNMEESWSVAADLSAQVHVMYKPRPYSLVLGAANRIYTELWTAGKAMYKLEPVVADGGELIIYGPHVDAVSHTWGKYIERVGYHVRDYYLAQPGRFDDVPKAVLAHSTHVKGAGKYESGEERPRIDVTLATGIPKEQCGKLGLGYRDPEGIRIEHYMNREDEGVLLVENAGEVLYRLKAHGVTSIRT